MQLTEKEKLLLTHWLQETSRLEKGPACELVLDHEVIPGDLGQLVVAWERSEGIKQAAVVFGDRPTEEPEWPWATAQECEERLKEADEFLGHRPSST